jgi:protein-S-isoprenylcysteine O-methyltransferase Ste14
LRFGLLLFQRIIGPANPTNKISNFEAKSLTARRGGKWFQRWRVPLGFLATPIFVLLAKPQAWTLAAGGAIALAGLALRAWASGHLRKNDALATTGPYAYTRNPLYLGSFLIGVGFTIAAGRWELAVLFAVLFLGIYVPVMRVESQTLEQLFGHKYRRYAQAVPMFVPRLTRFDGVAKAEFDVGLYKRYREYQAALGFAAAFAILIAKAIWFQ